MIQDQNQENKPPTESGAHDMDCLDGLSSMGLSYSFLILVFVGIHLDQVPMDWPIEFEIIIFYKAYIKKR